MRKTPEPIIKKIKELYASGKTILEIAKVVGYSYAAVRYHLIDSYKNSVKKQATIRRYEQEALSIVPKLDTNKLYDGQTYDDIG